MGGIIACGRAYMVWRKCCLTRRRTRPRLCFATVTGRVYISVSDQYIFMTSITPRVPKIDWSKGFDRHWNGRNAAVTHAFNALSFLFPQAEKFFIDVVRENVRNINVENDPELAQAIKGFIAQETIHTQQHHQYNAVLKSQGFKNVIYDFVERLQARSHKMFSPLTKLAVVCAYEHYTAILGNFILRNPKVLESASPDMALIWGWHSAEETEHKAVCFDLYQAAGGAWLHRVLVFFLVTLNFNLMFGRLYFSLLLHDNCLSPTRFFGTAFKSLSFFFGTSSITWYLLGQGFVYLSPKFHPWNQDNRSELRSWLLENQERLR